MELSLLQEAVIVLAFAVLFEYVSHRLRLPAMGGLLIAGVLIGPHGLGLIRSSAAVELLAELGAVTLLFTVGVEFSLERLLRWKRSVLVAGPLQVVLTTGATWLAMRLFTGLSSPEALFVGGLIALSSTAVVTKTLQDRAELESAGAYTTVGILIFQDVLAVILLTAVPLLAGQGASLTMVPAFLLKAGAVVLAIVLGARWLVPRLLAHVARTRSQELFLLTIVLLCLGVAEAASLAGLSLVFGAFLAGLIVSESPYSHHTLDHVIPFRDVFMTFFFVSVGMLLDVEYLLAHWWLVLLAILAVTVLKAILATVAILLAGLSPSIAVFSGAALAQIGEFSFVLAGTGLAARLISDAVYQPILAAAVISMMLAPYLIRAGDALASLTRSYQQGGEGLESTSSWDVDDLRDHLIIIGYGLVGRNVAHAARLVGVPYAIVELNPDTVLEERERGEPILYGDGSRRAVLEAVAVQRAQTIVVTVGDPATAQRVTQVVRELNPHAYLIVRTRYVSEVSALHRLGADDVVSEEHETALVIFERVLTRYQVSLDEIARMVGDLRCDDYMRLRAFDRPELAEEEGQAWETRLVDMAEDAPGVGKDLQELGLAGQKDLFVSCLIRNGRMIPAPKPDTIIEPHDRLAVGGIQQRVDRAVAQLVGPSRDTATGQPDLVVQKSRDRSDSAGA